MYYTVTFINNLNIIATSIYCYKRFLNLLLCVVAMSPLGMSEEIQSEMYEGELLISSGTQARQYDDLFKMFRALIMLLMMLMRTYIPTGLKNKVNST